MLLAGHLPRRREPQPQRRPSAVEDRPRRNRHLTPAHRALPTTAAQPPPSTPHAPRTAEPVRPAQPLKVVEAGRLVREPRQELRVRARVVLACLRHMRTLPELDRYPLSAQSRARQRDRFRPARGKCGSADPARGGGSSLPAFTKKQGLRADGARRLTRRRTTGLAAGDEHVAQLSGGETCLAVVAVLSLDADAGSGTAVSLAGRRRGEAAGFHQTQARTRPQDCGSPRCDNADAEMSREACAVEYGGSGARVLAAWSG